MTAFVSFLLRCLAFLCVLFGANALVPSTAWGYDAQARPSIAYDRASLQLAMEARRPQFVPKTATGQPVGGFFHTQKAQEMATSLSNWLSNNPNAASSDVAAAQNVLKDLQNALSGK